MTKAEIKIQIDLMYTLRISPASALEYWKIIGADLHLVKEALDELVEEAENEAS